jgi:hypothetical protein
VRHLVQVVLADAADEAVVLQLILHALHLVSQSAESVDNETWGRIDLSVLVVIYE